VKDIKTILHPTDFSRPCAAALEVACSLARDHGARLLLLHVIPAGAPPNGAGKNCRRGAEHEEEDRRSCREEMATQLQQLPLPGLSEHPEHLLVEGPVVLEIVRVAEERSCDVIVMGTHGWTGVARQVLGSVAEAVMRQAPCPVIMVKAPLAVSRKTEEVIPEEVGVIL